MTTARNLVKRALQIAGITTKNEEPSGDEITDGLSSLNDMLGSWSNESLFVYARAWETFDLTGGKLDYTIGSGGDFDTVRPMRIVTASLKSGIIDYPVSVISDVDYQNYTQKTTQGLPYALTFDNDYPSGKIRLYPVPTSGYKLSLLSEKPLTSYGLDDDVELPPGWGRAIRYNLAMEVSPEYGIDIPAVAAKIANESKIQIKRTVTKNRPLDAYKTPRVQNIYTGWS